MPLCDLYCFSLRHWSGTVCQCDAQDTAPPAARNGNCTPFLFSFFCCFKLGLFGLTVLHFDIYDNIIKSTLKNQQCIYIAYSYLVVWLCVESRWTSRGRHLDCAHEGKFPHCIPELCSRRLFSAIFTSTSSPETQNTTQSVISVIIYGIYHRSQTCKSNSTAVICDLKIVLLSSGPLTS